MVADAARGPDELLPDRFRLSDNQRLLQLQDALEHARGIVGEVRDDLLKRAFRRHVDGLPHEFFGIPVASQGFFHIQQHLGDVILRKESKIPGERDLYRVLLGPAHFTVAEGQAQVKVPRALHLQP